MIVITIEDEEGGSSYRYPKYFKSISNPEGINVPRRLVDYGKHDVCFIAADISDLDHAALASNSDVITIPQNLDTVLAREEVNAVSTILESFQIPSDWIATSTTYREVVRTVLRLFMFAQRYHGMHDERLVSSDFPMESRWQDIAIERQDKILGTAQSLGRSMQPPPGGRRGRQVLKQLADQWETPIHVGFGQII